MISNKPNNNVEDYDYTLAECFTEFNTQFQLTKCEPHVHQSPEKSQQSSKSPLLTWNDNELVLEDSFTNSDNQIESIKKINNYARKQTCTSPPHIKVHSNQCEIRADSNEATGCSVKEKPLTSDNEISLDESFQPQNISDYLNESINILKDELLDDIQDTTALQNKRRRQDCPDSKQVEEFENSFYGLPSYVGELIKKFKKIDKLYEWQHECLTMNSIENKKNLIYALPTSGGKTLVAEILMLKEIICNKRSAIFVLPFVALVQEKIQSMIPFALRLGFLIEEYAAEKGLYPPKKRRKKNSIYICTIEKAHSLINCFIELNRLNEVGIMVIDELHLLGESGGRGATLESLLTKIIYIDNHIRIVGMSATIGNINELAKFLNADLYVQNFRPIEVKEYVKCEDKIWLIDTKDEDLFTDMKVLTYPYSEKARKIDPDFLGGLVMDVAPNSSCLMFCSNKKNCENVAQLLTNVLFRRLKEHKKNEKTLLLDSLKIESNKICPILQQTIPFGVAYHHSGLTAEERRLIEEAFKQGTLCVICCTSTLAAGVNLPARRVILRSPYVAKDFLSLSRYKQMIGRAGRTGLGEIGESILICKNSEISEVRKLLSSKMDESISTLHSEPDRGLNSLLTSSVLLSIAVSRSDLHEIVSKTLLRIQEDNLKINCKILTDAALKKLLENGILRPKQQTKTVLDSKLNVSVVYPTQIENNLETAHDDEFDNKILVHRNTDLELCPLGRAALKGSISLNTAFTLYQDLKLAQKRLILLDHLHLLYLVTPYEVANQIKLTGSVYYEVLMKLPPHQMEVANIIGIDEAVAFKLRKGIIPNTASKSVIQRFYVTLILHELWNHQPIHIISEKFHIERGMIQNLLSAASSFALSTVRFCQELEDFWVFTDLLTSFSKKLTNCCAPELEQLMELPYIKQGRAKQLFKAGYKTLQSIAKSEPEQLVTKIEHMPTRIASQIIAAAKFLLVQKVENLRDEVEEVLDGLKM